MTHIDLFSGIGGFALATEMVWDDVTHVFSDNDPFCQAILKKHWPDSTIYGDINELIADTESNRRNRRVSKPLLEGKPNRATESRENVYKTVDILTGGFPCQPFSQAGRRKGTKDDRYLWPEMAAVIRNTKPTWVIAENVGGLVTWNNGLVLETVCTDLESEGYEVQPFIIPAVSKGAPHRRDRVWIIAYSRQQHGEQGSSERHQPNKTKRTPQTEESERHTAVVANTSNKGLQGRNEAIRQKRGRYANTRHSSASISWQEDWPKVATELCTMDDGLPNGLPRPRGWRNAALKAAGNAIVPQVAAEIMRTII